VGAGNRGENHAFRYDRIPDAEVVAVADVDESKARALAAAFDADHYPDHESMLAGADLDGVNLCVRAPLHAPIGTDALEAGPHVFCEKPMADGEYRSRVEGSGYDVEDVGVGLVTPLPTAALGLEATASTAPRSSAGRSLARRSSTPSERPARSNKRP